MGWAESVDFRCKVFDTILFFASEEGMKPIPNGEKEVLLEMAAAVSGYLTGIDGAIPAPADTIIYEGWTAWVNERIAEAIKANKKRLNPALVEALSDLLKIEWQHDHGDSSWRSGIDLPEQRGYKQVFYLTVPEAQRAREDVEKHLDADTVEHCKQIGVLMRKYIVRDLGENAN